MKLRPDLAMYGKAAQYQIGYIAGQLELTTRCFQKCKHCSSRLTKTHNEFTLSQAKSFCLSLETPPFEHLALTGGDPQAWQWLEQFLKWKLSSPLSFQFQVSTALMVDGDWGLWREALRDVRVSLDAVSPKIFKQLRGVDGVEKILERLKDLKHQRLATITTLSKENIDEVPSILDTLAQLPVLPRKAIFLPAIGVQHSPEFWKQYISTGAYLKKNWITFETNFAESPLATREFCQGEAAEHVPCFTGCISFHVKADGSVFPCCLVGGEAIATDYRMEIGNIHVKEINSIGRAFRPGHFYSSGSNPTCKEVCQWKQLQINLAGQKAQQTILAMP